VRYRACMASRQPVEVSEVPEFPDLTPESFWTRSPRGWIAGAATVAAIVVVVLLAWAW